MKQGTIADDFWLLSERDAAVAERLVKALDAVKATIGERFVDERPKMFGRLELWTVGWQKYEANAPSFLARANRHCRAEARRAW